MSSEDFPELTDRAQMTGRHELRVAIVMFLVVLAYNLFKVVQGVL